MPDDFRVYNTTVNAGVTTAAPTVTPILPAGIWVVDKVSIVIPAGHAGLTGIQLWYGGGAAIPYLSGWFSGDDDVIPLELSDIFPQGVPWSVAMVNADVIAHSFQTRWEMSYVKGGGGQASYQSLTAADIYAADDGGTVST